MNFQNLVRVVGGLSFVTMVVGMFLVALALVGTYMGWPLRQGAWHNVGIVTLVGFTGFVVAVLARALYPNGGPNA